MLARPARAAPRSLMMPFVPADGMKVCRSVPIPGGGVRAADDLAGIEGAHIRWRAAGEAYRDRSFAVLP